MRPQLMVNNLTDLHDARYCAAVGIFLQSFTLEKGHPKKLSVELLKELAQWLSGPKIIAAYGQEPASQINEDAATVGADYVSLPSKYDAAQAKTINTPIIFRYDPSSQPDADQLMSLLEQHPDALAIVDLPLPGDPNLGAMMENNLIPRIIFAVTDPDRAWAMLQKNGHAPFGFLLGSFFEEEGGSLDYEKCDDFVEKFNELLPA